MKLIAIALVIIVFCAAASAQFKRWGATWKEFEMELPGDSLTPDPKFESTRGILINAPAEFIYPWIVLLGQKKGGFYSYDFLENLAGLNIHSADSIIPGFQNIQLGDTLVMGPMGGPQLAMIKPNEYLVFHGKDDKNNNSWSFYLLPRGTNKTKLLVRSRNAYKFTFSNFIIWTIVRPISFIMEEKMLRGIRKRAENMYNVSLDTLSSGYWKPEKYRSSASK